LGLFAVVLLVLANGFFVAGEFGLVSVDRTKVEQLSEEGDRRARSTLAALKTLSFQLSGAQLGITVTSLVVGFLIEPAVAPALEPLLSLVGLPERTTLGVSVALGLVLATTLQMVVGELIPKNLAIAKPEAIAYGTATPLRVVNAIGRPLIFFLNSSANWTVRLLGIQPQDELSRTHSLEELQVMIRSSREVGTLSEEDFLLLARAISFGDKRAEDALVPRTAITAVDKDQSLEDLARIALDSGHSRFPVTDSDLDDVVGIAHVKDSYAIQPDARASTVVSEIMREPMVVPESRQLDSLLSEMRRNRHHMVVVIDEYGGTAGIITLEDLLEEIVGEIEDEHDPGDQQSHLTRAPEGIYTVSGMLHRDEVRDQTGFELPEGDFETLAGFLLALFDRVPRQGEHVSYEGWEFKVVEMDRKRIARVLLVAPPDVDEERREEP
jgi:CBS domain containing-hemolysin-like protein